MTKQIKKKCNFLFIHTNIKGTTYEGERLKQCATRDLSSNEYLFGTGG